MTSATTHFWPAEYTLSFKQSCGGQSDTRLSSSCSRESPSSSRICKRHPVGGFPVSSLRIVITLPPTARQSISQPKSKDWRALVCSRRSIRRLALKPVITLRFPLGCCRYCVSVIYSSSLRAGLCSGRFARAPYFYLARLQLLREPQCLTVSLIDPNRPSKEQRLGLVCLE
jgi:hypothetical protein